MFRYCPAFVMLGDDFGIKSFIWGFFQCYFLLLWCLPYEKSSLFFFSFLCFFIPPSCALKCTNQLSKQGLFAIWVVFFTELNLCKSLCLFIYKNFPSTFPVPARHVLMCTQKGEVRGNVGGPLALPNLIWPRYDLHTHVEIYTTLVFPSVKPTWSARSCL